MSTGFLIGFAKNDQDLRGHVAKKVVHKPHLFFCAKVVDVHKLQS